MGWALGPKPRYAPKNVTLTYSIGKAIGSMRTLCKSLVTPVTAGRQRSEQFGSQSALRGAWRGLGLPGLVQARRQLGVTPTGCAYSPNTSARHHKPMFGSAFSMTASVARISLLNVIEEVRAGP